LACIGKSFSVIALIEQGGRRESLGVPFEVFEVVIKLCEAINLFE